MFIANKQLLIAALSSRVYAESAVKAGYSVIAIDAFGDADLQQCVQQYYQVDAFAGQLDHTQLLKVLNKLDQSTLLGFCFGAGFEAHPEILNHINSHLPLLGNDAKVVERCKQPKHFFKLCEQLNIPFPAIRNKQPKGMNAWVQKTIGASGGAHVVPLSHAQQSHNSDVYYQQYQQGRTVTCLFVVSNAEVEVIGFNLQWSDANTFRYSGAASHVILSDLAKQRFHQYVSQLATSLGLQGANSCDAICDGDDLYIIEINPRLSASIDLYQQCGVLQKHLAAFGQHDASLSTQHQTPKMNCQQQDSFGHQIIYATNPYEIENKILWPSWVHDRPNKGAKFSIGMPICTVSAKADTALNVKAMLAERAKWVTRKLLN